MRALVTGGAGFIGSHVADALVGRGDEVFVIDDLSRGWRENVPRGARLYVADIRSPESKRAMEEIQPDVVFHLAAQVDRRASMADPVLDSDVNVTGTARLLAAAHKAGTELFVMASSARAIYGEQEAFPASEDHRIAPDSPFGVSKHCAELYLEYFGRRHKMRTVCLRCAHVYGPRQEPHGDSGVVAIFSEKMLRSEAPVVFGDGEQTRDCVFVSDVVRANLLVVDRLEARGTYNIATGVETSVNALSREIARLAGYSGEIRRGEPKQSEPRRSVSSSSRAERDLGWRPSVDLLDGLDRTVAWFKERVHVARVRRGR